MINEQKRKQLELTANGRMETLKKNNPDCSYTVIVYESGGREGEVVVQKETEWGEVTDYVIGSANVL